jgi:hypothetical protein
MNHKISHSFYDAPVWSYHLKHVFLIIRGLQRILAQQIYRLICANVPTFARVVKDTQRFMELQ